MAADWFCKIGEKKIGPLNGQQLKTIVAKGQLKAEHLVRRGSEGPWVAAGRIKGLFSGAAGAQVQGKKPPPATAKPLPKASAKPGSPPTAKASSLPTAAEAPAPPDADIPPEFALGGHGAHQAEMNVDSFYMEPPPATVSRKKVKADRKSAAPKVSGKKNKVVKGPKKGDQKKQTLLLVGLIGGGAIALGLIAWLVVANMTPKPTKPAVAAFDPIAAAEADRAKKAEKEAADKKAAEQATENWKKASVAETAVGNVVVKVLNPEVGPPPKGVKTDEGEVLIVPVNLILKAGEKTPVELTSWADASLKNKVSLKDDQKNSYAFLDQVAASGDSKAVTENRMQVQLVFQAPTGKKFKFLYLTLPPDALQAKSPMIWYEIGADDIRTEAAKSNEGVSGGTASKDDKTKPVKAKAAD